MTGGQFWAALALWREARNQSMAVRAAVYAVIRNRVMDKRWPNTLEGVVLQDKQFSSFNATDANAVLVPRSGADWIAWLECIAVVECGLLADPTEGATHYHDGSIEPPFKAWLGANATRGQLLDRRTLSLGAFHFYRL